MEQEATRTTPATPAPPASSPPDLSGESQATQRVYSRLLYYRRMSLQRGRAHVWPSIADLASYLRLDPSTVKRALRRLKKLGVITRRRTMLGNRYYFNDRPTDARGQNAPCAGGKMRPAYIRF